MVFLKCYYYILHTTKQKVLFYLHFSFVVVAFVVVLILFFTWRCFFVIDGSLFGFFGGRLAVIARVAT